LENVTLNHIRSSIEHFRLQEYGDKGTSNLPIRPDVAEFVPELFDTYTKTGFLPERITYPDLTLNDDGTVEVAFATFNRELLLMFPCKGIIAYVQGFPHEDTVIEGTLHFDTDVNIESSSGKLDYLFDWVGKK